MAEKTTERNEIKRLKLMATIVTAVVIAAGLYASWAWMCTVENGLLAGWALAATLGLPTMLWCGYMLGNMRANEYARGLQQGMVQVGRYTRSNGTLVEEHERAAPNITHRQGRNGETASV